ncbi:DUF4872 domain-containing protein [Virgibacillus sp. YIM 98842]|uniref:DUF4872 domain-containing protein n=1 Tax=Virgibacillus sp. YIM 98842 TaxID=2663533 RepID=UPI0013DD116F|nr:DUF4872 domain-containing protein [Virgibacillus sp. YIM 98842]
MTLTTLLMERAGTKGSLLRNLYKDFLLECLDIVDDTRVEKVYRIYTEVALLRREVSISIDQAGKNETEKLLKPPTY